MGPEALVLKIAGSPAQFRVCLARVGMLLRSCPFSSPASRNFKVNSDAILTTILTAASLIFLLSGRLVIRSDVHRLLVCVNQLFSTVPLAPAPQKPLWRRAFRSTACVHCPASFRHRHSCRVVFPSRTGLIISRRPFTSSSVSLSTTPDSPVAPSHCLPARRVTSAQTLTDTPNSRPESHSTRTLLASLTSVDSKRAGRSDCVSTVTRAAATRLRTVRTTSTCLRRLHAVWNEILLQPTHTLLFAAAHHGRS